MTCTVLGTTVISVCWWRKTGSFEEQVQCRYVTHKQWRTVCS